MTLDELKAAVKAFKERTGDHDFSFEDTILRTRLVAECTEHQVDFNDL